MVFQTHFEKIKQNSKFSAVQSHFIINNMRNIINDKVASFASPISPQIPITHNFQVNLTNANSYLDTDANFILKYEELLVLDHFLENFLKMF